jgi:methylated-DNA-[protein]-cysteine S-methyltransferase
MESACDVGCLTEIEHETAPARFVFPEVMSEMTTPRPRYAIGSTSLGAFGVAWSEQGIVRTWMHTHSESATRAAILRALPHAIAATPTPAIEAAIADVRRLLDGEPRTLAAADLDMSGTPPFDRRVYEFARTIAPGSTMTYGAVAAALGEEPMRARDVGQALARNPFAPIVPCHRVVAAHGRLGGYSAPGGASTKRRLLEREGADIVESAPQQFGLFDRV